MKAVLPQSKPEPFDELGVCDKFRGIGPITSESEIRTSSRSPRSFVFDFQAGLAPAVEGNGPTRIRPSTLGFRPSAFFTADIAVPSSRRRALPRANGLRSV